MRYGWDFTDVLFAGYELMNWPCSGTPCSNSLDFVSELRAEHRFRAHPVARTLIPTAKRL